MTDFTDKQTVIEAAWLNGVDATVNDMLQGATTAQAARAALDVPQETAETDPQVRVNGAWTALATAPIAEHATTHVAGGIDEVDHDLLTNGAGSKHIDHSAVSVSGGSGLIGGGTIDTDRIISFSYLLEQDMDAGGFKITDLAEPATGSDAATMSYVNTRVIDAGGTPWTPGVPADSIFYSLGMIGIGTDTPVKKLDLRGDAYIGGDCQITGITGLNKPPGSRPLEVQASASGGISVTAAVTGWGLEMISSTGYQSGIRSDASHGRMILKNATGETEVDLRSDANSYITGGSLGVGTTSPSAKLDVVGTTELNGDCTVDGDIAISGTITGPDADWTTLGNFQYIKLADGSVELRGISTSSWSGTLPATHRPSGNVWLLLADLDGSTCQLLIDSTTGEVLSQSGTPLSGARARFATV